jgi:hypothetical protein
MICIIGMIYHPLGVCYCIVAKRIMRLVVYLRHTSLYTLIPTQISSLQDSVCSAFRFIET